MHTAVIRYRVADFLKRYAPFDALHQEDLLALSGSGRVHFHESEELVFTLDALCNLFGIEPHDRHTAGGDAFITAQFFLRLLRYAQRAGRTGLDALCQPWQAPQPTDGT
jgi:hypothetical protein